MDADAAAATTRPDSEPLEWYCDGLCCFGMHAAGPATCQECKAETHFPIHALCATCAKRGNRCTHCMKPIRK